MQTRIFLENIDFALRITVKRGAMHSAVYPLLTVIWAQAGKTHMAWVANVQILVMSMYVPILMSYNF